MLIGYVRVAKAEAQDAAVQVDALSAAGCAKIFREPASGGRWDHPAFKRMLEELQPGDVVVVPTLDHLARSLADLIHMMEKILRCGADIRSLTEPVEISGSSAQLISALAKFDRGQLKVRTAEGQKAARARGNGGGRTAKLSPTQQREIIDMLAAGRPAADLARLFRVHRATISRLASKAHRVGITDTADVR